MLVKFCVEVDFHTATDPQDFSATMFRHRQQQRRWAARMLFLWMFGLAAGIANACLGQDSAPAAAERAGFRAANLVYLHDAAPDAYADDGAGSQRFQHGPATGPDKANCQDFCDKASESVPASSSAPGAHLDAMLLSAAGLPPQATALQLPPWVPRRDGVRPPPIPIVFLRLAL